MVGDALVDITDGAFSESLRGVVLGRPVNLQVTDADLDIERQCRHAKGRRRSVSREDDGGDRVRASGRHHQGGGRRRGSAIAELDRGSRARPKSTAQADRHLEVTLTEVKLAHASPAAEKEPAADSAASRRAKQPDPPATGNKPAATPAKNSDPGTKQPAARQPQRNRPRTPVQGLGRQDAADRRPGRGRQPAGQHRRGRQGCKAGRLGPGSGPGRQTAGRTGGGR